MGGVHEKVFLWIKGQQKNQLRQIILALDLGAIKLSSLLTIDLFEIESVLDKSLTRVK